MKRCMECGHLLEDDMMFCQKCGAQVIIAEKKAVIDKSATRKGMKVAAIIAFVLAGIYAVMAFAMPMMVAMIPFCAILGGMFWVLSKSPKENPYLFGKTKGMKKKTFVWICCGIAFLLFGIIMEAVGVPSEKNKTAPAAVSVQAESQERVSEEKELHENVSLDEIKRWYEKQMPNVSRSLIQYADSVAGLSAMNVEQSKFRFGEDAGWYDCHYTVHFVCRINGARCIGEGRAFLKYGETEPKWFHFEIWRERDGKTMIEQYDKSYEKVIEEYYKSLKMQSE